MVPQLVICHKCGAILYESVELKPPDEIIQSYNGKCPACNKKLSYIPKNFEVKLVAETKKLSLLESEKKKPSRKKRKKK